MGRGPIQKLKNLKQKQKKQKIISKCTLNGESLVRMTGEISQAPSSTSMVKYFQKIRKATNKNAKLLHLPGMARADWFLGA